MTTRCADFATCDFVDGNVLHWGVDLTGPAGSAYEGLGVHFDLVFPADYPFKPPAVHFVGKKMWHPRVEFDTGLVCLPLLKESYSPACSMPQLMEAIRSILEAPFSDSPLNQEAQAQLDSDADAFAAQCRDVMG